MLHYTDDQQMQAYHTSTPSLTYGMAAVISYAEIIFRELYFAS